MRAFIFCWILLSPLPAIAHKGEDHSKGQKDQKAPKHTEPAPHESLDDSTVQAALLQINTVYLETIKPIFLEKCLPCHGESQDLPWYYVLPGPNHLMDHDMEEAKEHLDMRGDFPFEGHGSPTEDLQAIVSSTEEDDMPPWTYRMVHWDSTLTQEEAELVITWATDGLELLKAKGP